MRLVIGVGEEDGHVAVRQAVDEVGADAEDLLADRVGLAEARGAEPGDELALRGVGLSWESRNGPFGMI